MAVATCEASDSTACDVSMGAFCWHKGNDDVGELPAPEWSFILSCKRDSPLSIFNPESTDFIAFLLYAQQYYYG